jgi:hypothetical protein
LEAFQLAQLAKTDAMQDSIFSDIHARSKAREAKFQALEDKFQDKEFETDAARQELTKRMDDQHLRRMEDISKEGQAVRDVTESVQSTFEAINQGVEEK